MLKLMALGATLTTRLANDNGDPATFFVLRCLPASERDKVEADLFDNAGAMATLDSEKLLALQQTDPAAATKLVAEAFTNHRLKRMDGEAGSKLYRRTLAKVLVEVRNLEIGDSIIEVMTPDDEAFPHLIDSLELADVVELVNHAIAANGLDPEEKKPSATPGDTSEPPTT